MAPTISSREIAELTCKEHKNVTRDIRVMLDELNLGASKFGDIYFDAQNRKQTEYKLDDLPAGKFITRFGNAMKVYDLTIDQMMLVGMRESKHVRRNIRDKLKELEKKSQPKIPQTLPEALLLAAELAKQNEETQRQLAIAAPKAESADRIASADSLKSEAYLFLKLFLAFCNAFISSSTSLWLRQVETY